jgi:hypothetical protein
MSILKTIYLQHLNGSSPNATLDANGNMTVTGTVAGASPMMFRNKVINGDMRIDQRYAGSSVSNIYGYGVDRWAGYYLGSGTGRFSAQQSSTAPTGFKNSWLLTVTTADSSPSSGYGYGITHTIEGYNIADLNFGSSNALSVTVSFWVRSSVTGTFPFTISNGTSTRTYGSTYTINSANTFEYKTITIPGDVTGTWTYDNTGGIYMVFGFGGGSTRAASAGWQTFSGSTATMVTGCTQLIATNGATFYITGVQLEAGTKATPFEYRQFTTELQLCQRYYEKSYLLEHVPGTNSTYGISTGIVDGGSSTAIACNITYRVTKRTAPAVSFYKFDGTANVWARNTDNASTGTLSYPWGGATHGLYRIDSSAQALSTTYMFHGHWIASAEL